MNAVYTISVIVVLFLPQLSCTENIDGHDGKNACADCGLNISSTLFSDQ